MVRVVVDRGRLVGLCSIDERLVDATVEVTHTPFVLVVTLVVTAEFGSQIAVVESHDVGQTLGERLDGDDDGRSLVDGHLPLFGILLVVIEELSVETSDVASGGHILHHDQVLGSMDERLEVEETGKVDFSVLVVGGYRHYRFVDKCLAHLALTSGKNERPRAVSDPETEEDKVERREQTVSEHVGNRETVTGHERVSVHGQTKERIGDFGHFDEALGPRSLQVLVDFGVEDLVGNCFAGLVTVVAVGIEATARVSGFGRFEIVDVEYTCAGFGGSREGDIARRSGSLSSLSISTRSRSCPVASLVVGCGQRSGNVALVQRVDVSSLVLAKVVVDGDHRRVIEHSDGQGTEGDGESIIHERIGRQSQGHRS